MPDGIELRGPVVPERDRILTEEALAFVGDLQRRFGPVRLELLRRREERQVEIDAGVLPDFLVATRDVRESEWTVAPAPADLDDRRVEITGPAEPKMMINALNSGARVFMADLEDALSPTWANMVAGQAAIADATRGTLAFDSPEGKAYRLDEDRATLVVRPRGWHLIESHVLVDGTPVSASLFDFGMYLFHSGRAAIEAGSGPYLYLAKLESHHEARLWNEVFVHAQAALGIPRGTIRATVLIETILAAFEMDEILYELREHAAGLNAGRWDYLFSAIKKFRTDPRMSTPDRAQLTMTVPFMRAYTELLVRTCHGRGAHAIGGMAAFIPNRRDAEVTERALARVRDDKVRESGDGFDGTWVAHPDLVPVAKEVFDGVLGERPNQKARTRDEVDVGAGGAARLHGRRRRRHGRRRAREHPRRARVSRFVAARRGRRRHRQPDGGCGDRRDQPLAALDVDHPGRRPRRRVDLRSRTVLGDPQRGAGAARWSGGGPSGGGRRPARPTRAG